MHIACEDKLGIYQVGAASENYIQGNINGKPFYYGDKDSKFKIRQSTTSISDGQGAPMQTFIFGLVDTLTQRYAYLPAINRPAFNFNFDLLANQSMSAQEAYDKYLKPGDLLVTSRTTSFNEPSIRIIMDVSCDNKLYTIRRSSAGNQDGSYFKIKTVERSENETSITWMVSADFDMQVYKDALGEQLWHRITEGKTKMTFSVNK